MSKENKSATLAGLLVIAVILMLTSCASYEKPNGPSTRLSVGAGITHAKVEVDGGGSESGRGYTAGIRLEVARKPDYIKNTQVGLRFQGSTRDMSEGGFGDGTGRIDLDHDSAEMHVTLRHFFPISRSVRFFGEVFGGVAYQDGDVTASGSGLLTPLTGSESDWGPVGGAGLGLEFDLSPSTSLFIQGDYSARLGDASVFDLQLQDWILWGGGEVRF